MPLGRQQDCVLLRNLFFWVSKHSSRNKLWKNLRILCPNLTPRNGLRVIKLKRYTFVHYICRTRMHSSRMRTVRSSSRLLVGGGVCLSACWNTHTHTHTHWAWAWAWTQPPRLGLDTPPRHGPGYPPGRPPNPPGHGPGFPPGRASNPRPPGLGLDTNLQNGKQLLHLFSNMTICLSITVNSACGHVDFQLACPARMDKLKIWIKQWLLK